MRTRSCLLVILIFVFGLSISGNVARGTLLSVNGSFGNGTITRDTNTGLDWLDWTVTTNISFNSMVPKLLAGGTFAGWRYATEAEVATLYFTSAGINTNDAIADCAADILALQALLGQTNSGGTLGGAGFAFRYSTAMYDIHGGLGLITTGLAVRTQDGPYSLASAYTGDGSSVDWFASDHIGHILVQAIPEPGSIILPLLPLATIFSQRRKKVNSI